MDTAEAHPSGSDAPRAADPVAEYLQIGALSGGERDRSGPFGGRLWIVAGRHEADETRALLAARAPGVLAPAVSTLPAAAASVIDHAGLQERVLSPVQQRRIVAEVLESAARRSSLGPLQDLSGTPGLLDYVAARVHQLRLTGDAPDAIAGRLVGSEGEVGAALAPLFDRYCKELERHGLLDPAAVFGRAATVAADRVRLDLLVVEWLPRELSAVEDRFLASLAAGREAGRRRRPQRRGERQRRAERWGSARTLARLDERVAVDSVGRAAP